MFYIVLLLSLFAQTKCAQPYFPSQITFIAQYSNSNFTYAIDEVNQRAFLSEGTDQVGQLRSYVMEHFPNADPDSPQSKYYVILSDYQKSYCQYSTAWQYGSVDANLFFPSHWGSADQYKITNYMAFRSDMILVNDSAPNEDYWRSVTECTLDSGDLAPCEEIFFKKNTEVPLRYKSIQHPAMLTYQYTVNFQVISIGKPDDRLFETIPNDWKDNCTDLDLHFECNNPNVFIGSNQTVTIRIRMTTPPHKENGNDTILARLQIDETYSICVDCITWEPKEFYFNSENFHEYRNVTLTRVKNGSRTVLIPRAQGGGFEKVTEDYYIYII